MAKVMTFFVKEVNTESEDPRERRFGGVPDKAIEAFVTECERTHYVNVVCTYIPIPTPRLNVIVTNLDEREQKITIDQTIKTNDLKKVK